MRELIKRKALLVITPAIAIMALLAIGVTAQIYFVQERLAESFLTSYARDMAYAFSYVEGVSDGHHMHGRHEYEEHHFIASGSSMPGGLVFIVSSDGGVVASSPEARHLRDMSFKDLINGDKGYRLTDHKGKSYYLVWDSITAFEKIVFVIPNDEVFTSLISAYKWLISILIFLALSFLGLTWCLWRYLISPMRKMSRTIRGLRWGRELLTEEPSPCVWEVEVMNDALRKQAELAVDNERLKENYVRDIITVQEEERRHFARELHDGPLQYVSAAIKRIQIFKALCADAGNTIVGAQNILENLVEAEKAAQFSADEMRNLCDEMSPPWLELGFPNALMELTDRAERSGDVRVTLKISDNARKMKLARDKEIALMRLFQEACSNSTLHGKARNIEVELSSDGENAILSIRDDGIGFDAAVIEESKLCAGEHRGISNMMERMRLVGGNARVVSSPNNGCTVQAKVRI
jgi:signal transduction histidine kinase